MNPLSIWFRLRAEPSPIRFIVSRVLWRSGFSSRFVVRRHGYRLRFHPAAVSAWNWTYPRALHTEEEFIASNLSPGDTYVDVGANVGVLALRAASVVGIGGRVIAIEAHPRTYKFLQENITLNAFENVAAVNRAAGHAEGTLTFSDYLSDDQNHVVNGTSGISVPVQRLDDLIPEGPVALLKIDVEGFELSVLRGAMALLSRTRMVLFESWDALSSRYGHPASAAIELLRESGFVVYRLVGQHLQLLGTETESPNCENLVAIRARNNSVAGSASNG